MLKIENLHVSYGGIKALQGSAWRVPDGKIVTLIGANGAGKSTTLRTISGLVKADSGSITYDGQELLGKPINKILEAGIAQVSEGRRVFANSLCWKTCGSARTCARIRTALRRICSGSTPCSPRLEERSWQLAGTLSGGEQQMLAVGRALMSRPKVLMMDEPSLGLAPLVVQGIFDIIRTINKEGVTVLLIEQECQHGPEGGGSCLCAGDRHHHQVRHRRRALADESIKEAYLGRTKSKSKRPYRIWYGRFKRPDFSGKGMQ